MPWNFRNIWKPTFLHIPLMGILILILSIIPVILQRNVGMPGGVESIGWTVLQRITQKPHPYNSNENLIVRQYLVDTLFQIQHEYDKRNCSRPNPIQIEAIDDINLFIPDRALYFESSNIVVWIQGSQQESLLVSSHFDSAPVAKGATDAGIGIASMVDVLDRISKFACHEPLVNSIVFNFNNAEEDYLLGGSAFTKHPKFKDIKAFINLEGTGASAELRSAMFRTNSFPLLSKVMKSAPYPHSSVIFNDVMRFIQSETDFRPYSTVGSLPGLDYAFYSYRYLYHTPRDDILHSSQKSIEFSIANLYQGAIDIVQDISFLKKIQLGSDMLADPLQPNLPIPSFSFFDRFGLWSVIESQSTFILSHFILFTCMVATAVLRMGILYFWSGKQSLMKNLLKPAILSFLLVVFTFLVTMISGIIFMIFKTWINAGISYGHPELVLVSLIVLTLGSFCICLLIWQKIAKRLHLTGSNSRFTSHYDSLPASALILDNHSDDDIDSNQNSNSATIESPESPGQSSNPEEEPLLGHVPYQYRSAEKDRSVTIWLPVGLSMFWAINLLISLVASIAGITAFYYFYDFALFSVISILLSFFLDQIYKKLLHEDVSIEYSWIETKFLYFYENYYWIIQLLLSTVVPFMFTVDIMNTFLQSIPSLVGEGITDWKMDVALLYHVVILLINFLPLLSRTNRRNSGIFFILCFLSLWFPQLFLFPFSVDRPYKYRFTELLDVTNVTTSTQKHVIISTMSSMPASRWVRDVTHRQIPFPTTLQVSSQSVSFEYPNTSPFAKYIDVHWQKQTKKGKVTITGNITGSSGSRKCKLIPHYNVSTFWLDATTKWQVYPTEISYDEGVTIFKRSFTKSNRIHFDFGFELPENVTVSNRFEFNVNCYYSPEQSEFYGLLVDKQPLWTISNGGSFIISKLITIE